LPCRNFAVASDCRASDAFSIPHRPNCRRAAAYAIQTISEAVRQIPDDWLAEFPTEPWGQIKRIGDRIRHEYFRVDDAILWQVITTDAPALETVLRTMLKRHAGGS